MFFKLPFFNSIRGDEAKPMLADNRGVLVQSANSDLAHAAKSGKVFTGSAAAAGSVLPIFSNTAQVFGLWNPAGSGVDAFITSIAASYVDTTGAAGGFVLGIVKNAGSATATGAAVSAFTEGTPEPGIAGSRLGGNKVRFTPSAATVTAPSILRHLGIGQLVLTASDATNGIFHFYRDFRGDLAIAPNTAVFLCGNIATLSKWAASITWVEEPV